MKHVAIFIVLVVLVISLQYVGGYLIYQNIEGWPERGTFGDMFGAVNTFFSGLAFAGILYAIFLQHKELSLQRRELELTREELKRSAKAQEKSEEALSEQAKALLQTAKLNALNFIPTLSLRTDEATNKVPFQIVNMGNTSAYDVDVLVIGVYSIEDIDPKLFFDDYVTKKVDITDRILNSTIESYGVYDRLSYAVIPQRRKVSCDLEFPIAPHGMYVLLQFYDIQGINYHQVYWLFSKKDSEGFYTYYLGSIEPKAPFICSRIGFDDKLTLVTEDNSDLPSHISDEFALYWQFSIPSGCTVKGLPDIEDRGYWSDI